MTHNPEQSPDLGELRAKAQKASPLPWSGCIVPHQHPGADDADLPFGVFSATDQKRELFFLDERYKGGERPGIYENDGEYLVAACNALPALADEIDSLRSRLQVAEGALGAMRAWLGIIADKIDLDPDGTRVTINAVGPNGKREVATRSLRDIYEQADAALATAGFLQSLPDGKETT